MKPEDYTAVHRIMTQVHNLHLDNRPDLYKISDPFDEEYFESLSNDQNSILLVAENDDEITGICIATIKEVEDSPVQNARKYIFIEDICVDEKVRKSGIGRILYNAVVDIAKALKAESIELTVFGFNQTAINFYEGLGMNIMNIRYEHKIDNSPQ